MSKKSDAPEAPVAAQRAGGIVHRDEAHAPIVYFEAAPNFGHMNGIISVTLSAGRAILNQDGTTIDSDAVVVAYLRCNIPAAINLRRALDDALLLAQPAPPASQ